VPEVAEDPERVPVTRRATMADVAAHAGVSLKTVSRVVNREPHVSPQLAERVRISIAALGFRRDAGARQLASRTTGPLLGYVQVDAANPFFGGVARGLEDVTSPQGYLVLTGSTDADPVREARLLETLVEARVAGIVVAAAEGGDEVLRQELTHGTAIVLVDRQLPGADCDTVTSTNRSGTTEAVRALLTAGHRRVAFLGGDPAVWTAAERRAGFEAAVAEAGLAEGGRRVVDGVGAVALADAATHELLDGADPPTAILAAQDRIGLGVLEALRARDAQHEVALVVFDEIPHAALLDPPVATIAQDPVALGRSAGELLVARLRGERRPGPRTVEIPTRFHARASAMIAPS
jgi:LacI family transcriptional regulator